MATNKLQWKRIAKGDKLPCQSFLRKKNGEILKLSTGAGVTVGQDAYYLPVDDVIEEIKNYPIEESEDERVCRKLIAFLKQCKAVYGDDFKQFGLDIDDAIAWLEKQGEHARFIEAIQVGDKVTKNEDGVLVNLSQLKRVAKPAEEQYNISGIGSKNAQGKLGEMIKKLKPVNEVLEQKPAEWTSRDDDMLNSIIDTLDCIDIRTNTEGEHEDHIKERVWLLELKDRVLPQPKQEWSEKDKGNLLDVKCIIDEVWHNQYVRETIDHSCEELEPLWHWLDNIWQRVEYSQNTWKPSDEQMRALESIFAKHGAYNDDLLSLISDLKKLKD